MTKKKFQEVLGKLLDKLHDQVSLGKGVASSEAALKTCDQVNDLLKVYNETTI